MSVVTFPAFGDPDSPGRPRLLFGPWVEDREWVAFEAPWQGRVAVCPVTPTG